MGPLFTKFSDPEWGAVSLQLISVQAPDPILSQSVMRKETEHGGVKNTQPRGIIRWIVSPADSTVVVITIINTN